MEVGGLHLKGNRDAHCVEAQQLDSPQNIGQIMGETDGASSPHSIKEGLREHQTIPLSCSYFTLTRSP